MWKQLISTLNLIPLEGEGGLFASTYQSSKQCDGAPIGTAIYYMLVGDAFSHMHKLSGDEVYHFYQGDPVELLLLHPDGRSEIIHLGSDILGGQQVQYTVPADVWQGSRLLPGGEYALMGTTMSPGYTEGSYLHANHPAALVAQYPNHQNEIIARTGVPIFNHT